MQFHNKSPVEQQQINTSNDNQQEQNQKDKQMKSKEKQRRRSKHQKQQKDKSVTNSMNDSKRNNKSQVINVQQIDMGPQQLIEDEQDEDFGYQANKNRLTKKQHQENSYKPITLLIRLIKFVALAIIVVVVVMFYTQSINQGRQYAKNSTRDMGLKNITVKNDSAEISRVTNQSKIIQNRDKTSTNQSERRESEGKQEMYQQSPNNQNDQQLDDEEQDSNLPENYSQDRQSGNLFTNPQYVIKIKALQFPPFKINNIDISQYGIGKDIQIGTIYDYLNITHSKEFQSFKKLWTGRLEQIFPADIYQLPKLQSQQSSKNNAQKPQNSVYTSILQYSQFKNQQEMNAYLNSLNNWNNQRNYGSDLQLHLSSHIIWNETSSKLKQIQLYLLQKKYNLSRYNEELPICVFSTGYQIYSRNRHQYFLQSLEKQNYTNFHIIAVDDCSPDQSGPKIFQFLKQSSMRIKQKITIVRNKYNLGATASTYYWTRKLCKPGQIVVHVDLDDMLLGRQVFKTLNAVYHNKDVWYAYTRYLRQDNPQMLPNAGKSRAINFNIKEYRFLVDWKTSAMRTFRYQIMNNVPIEHLVQYHYNEQKEILHPKFYDTDADRFLIYSQLQLCDNKHIKYLNDVFYYYNVTNNVASKCNMRHQHFDQYKSRIKIPVKPMVTLQDQGALFVDRQLYSVPQNVTQALKRKYELYQKCLQQN